MLCTNIGSKSSSNKYDIIEWSVFAMKPYTFTMIMQF